MSYVRWSEQSDVYVFLADGHLECCGCDLGDEWAFYSTDDMLAHLRAHQAAGHTVPQYAFDGLGADRADNDAEIMRPQFTGTEG